MKMVLMAIVVLGLLGGGGAGAYYYFQHPALASIGSDGEVVKESRAKQERSGEPKYVNLDPLSLPIIDDKGVTSNVSIVVALQVEDEKSVNEIKKQMPRLIDAYIQNMYGMLNKREALKGGVVQVGLVKDRLNQITKKVLGDDMVDDVLLQVVSQRAM
ncbi:MAG TPA: flagellar basal body-associated FliL family protein [Patescibacteria group bacterium]|nr:flagellar basal body-associated FliL family protein [Patescibacteria group bacterium]